MMSEQTVLEQKNTRQFRTKICATAKHAHHFLYTIMKQVMQSPLVLQNAFFTPTQVIVMLITIAFQLNVTPE
jgi:hypothetical protein